MKIAVSLPDARVVKRPIVVPPGHHVPMVSGIRTVVVPALGGIRAAYCHPCALHVYRLGGRARNRPILARAAEQRGREIEVIFSGPTSWRCPRFALLRAGHRRQVAGSAARQAGQGPSWPWPATARWGRTPCGCNPPPASATWSPSAWCADGSQRNRAQRRLRQAAEDQLSIPRSTAWC